MNKTDNYNLSQWALEDRVRMEDFNADNANIEAALTALAAGLAEKAPAADADALKSTKLQVDTLLSKTFTITEDSFVIDVPGQEIGNSVIAIMVLTPISLTSKAMLYYNTYTTTRGGIHYPASTTDRAVGLMPLTTDSHTSAVFFPMKHPSHFLHGIYFANTEFGFFYDNVTYSAMTKISFRSTNSNALTGSGTVKIYGIR